MLWHCAIELSQGNERLRVFFSASRRRLQWYRLIAQGEQYRREHSEEGKRGMAIQLPKGYVSALVFCQRHQAMFRQVGANIAVAANNLSREFMEHMLAKHKPANGEEFGKAMQELASSGTPMCCEVGDAVVDRVLAATPLSTGDPKEDIRIAAEDGEKNNHEPRKTH